jgi:putative glutamine transport system substrate-binding protein
MKKLFALLSAMVFLAIAGCGNGSGTPTTPPPPPPSTAPDPATPPAVPDPATPEVDALPAEVQAIADRGVLKVGVKVDVPQFGFMNPDTNEQEGLEADLAREIAKRIVGDESKVEFQAVTAKTRGPLLDNNEVDMVIATFTITEERKLSYNFTQPYFVDGIGFLVKRDLGATTIKDLDGKTIAVAQSATTKDALDEKAAELGITFKYSEYASYPEAKTALISGRVDAFSVDKSILLGYVDDSTILLEETFKPQEYGIASKFDNKELAAYLDDFIGEIKGNGTLDALIQKWNLD